MKNIFRILFLILLFSACTKDYLQKYPLDKPSDQTFLSTPEEMEVASNALYNGLYWKWNWENTSTFFALDYGTDIGIRRPENAYTFPWVYSGQDASTGIFRNAWSVFYKNIERANYIIEKLPLSKENVDEGFYNRIMAEALWHRAFSYFYLTELFGDVPFIDKVLFNYNEAYSYQRTSKATIVISILKDLDFCIANLPDAWGGADYGRVSKATAGALKARIALYNEKWDVAANAAQTVMGLGIDLAPDYEKLFLYEGNQKPEVLLAIQYQKDNVYQSFPTIGGSLNVGGWSITMPTRSLVDSYECMDGLPISESPIFDPRNPYENRDPRLKATILTPGQWFCKSLFNIYDPITSQIVNGVTVAIKNQDFTYTGITTFTGFLQKKSIDPKDVYDNTIWNSQNATILFRYAEVLLTYAEAKVELNQFDQSVCDATINKIRSRVNMPAKNVGGLSQAQKRSLVRQERKIELALEGQRFFDIRRWKFAEHIMNNDYLIGRYKQSVLNGSLSVPRPTFDEWGISHYLNEKDLFEAIPLKFKFNKDRDYLWPIPQTEINVVPTLDQNPGY